MTFQKSLQDWHKKHKFTQQQTAAHLAIPYRTFQEWLAGHNAPHVDRQSVILKRMEEFDNAPAAQ